VVNTKKVNAMPKVLWKHGTLVRMGYKSRSRGVNAIVHKIFGLPRYSSQAWFHPNFGHLSQELFQILIEGKVRGRAVLHGRSAVAALKPAAEHVQLAGVAAFSTAGAPWLH
jgi:hypothetical protein